MPRSTLARRDYRVFDFATELRSQSAAALSATTNGTGLFIPEANAALVLHFEVRVAAYTGYVAGTAQWQIIIQGSADNTTYVDIQSFVPTGTGGIFTFKSSGMELEGINPGCKYLRVRAVLTGAAGNLTYGAFVTMH